MDYSLLFGIERVDSLKDVKDMRGLIKSYECLDIDGNKFYQVFYISILDYLQDYSLQKKIETKRNKFKKGNPKDRSAIPPVKYQERFYNFIKNHVIKPKSTECYKKDLNSLMK